MAGSHFSSTTPMSHHNYYQNPYATPYPYGYLGGPAQQPDFSVAQQGNAGQGQNPATTGAQFTQQSTNVPPPYIPAYVPPPTGAQQRYANPAAPETSNIQFGSFPPYNPYAFANPAQTYPLADNSDTDESPFVKELHEYEMPATAKLPHLKVYDGTTCPDSHIDMYKWQMQSLRLDKRFWCTHFPTTLDGNAGLWFKSLAPRSIRSFAELKQLFLTNFMQLRKYRGDVREIIGCRQMEGETIQKYFQRFNTATMNVPGHNDNIVTGAFTHGLLPGTLSTKFVGRMPNTRDELKERVEKYLRQTAGHTTKTAYLKAASSQHDKEDGNYNHRHSHRRQRYPKPYADYGRDERRSNYPGVLMVDERPKTDTRPDNYPRSKSRYCEYHGRSGHGTTECFGLRRELEGKTPPPDLIAYARMLRQKNASAELPPPPRRGAPPAGGRREEILMIESDSQEVWETWKQPEGIPDNIAFTRDDPTPAGWSAKYPMVLEAEIHGFYGIHALIDSGSGKDIMFRHFFRKLPQAWQREAHKSRTRLTGLGENSVKLVGVIRFPITLRGYNGSKTVMLEFQIVDARSSYDLILGRTTLLSFGAIVSTLHGLAKFRTRTGHLVTVGAVPIPKKRHPVEYRSRRKLEFLTDGSDRESEQGTNPPSRRMAARRRKKCREGGKQNNWKKEDIAELYEMMESDSLPAKYTGLGMQAYMRRMENNSPVRLGEEHEWGHTQAHWREATVSPTRAKEQSGTHKTHSHGEKGRAPSLEKLYASPPEHQPHFMAHTAKMKNNSPPRRPEKATRQHSSTCHKWISKGTPEKIDTDEDTEEGTSSPGKGIAHWVKEMDSHFFKVTGQTSKVSR